MKGRRAFLAEGMVGAKHGDMGQSACCQPPSALHSLEMRCEAGVEDETGEVGRSQVMEDLACLGTEL